ncbi:hypothetical protein A2U01_0106084, partial [Trifolium medium]|nr:hypothetical protein [Trifolium medium]
HLQDAENEIAALQDVIQQQQGQNNQLHLDILGVQDEQAADQAQLNAIIQQEIQTIQ